MTSLNFTSNSDERVTVSASSSIDALESLSILVWFKQEVQNTNNALFRKGAMKQVKVAASDSDDFQFIVQRATTNAVAITNVGFSTNVWSFLACTFSAGTGPKIYGGGLRTLAFELSYASQTTGSGALTDDTGNQGSIGGRNSGTKGFGGDVAYLAYFNEVLSQGQIRAQQFFPHNVSSMVARWHLGVDGTNSVPDLSGNGNNGTLNGTLGPSVGAGLPVELLMVGTSADIPFAVQDSVAHLERSQREQFLRNTESQRLLARQRRQPLSVWS